MSACRFESSTRQDIINARGHFSLFFSHFFQVSFSGNQGTENFDAKREKGKLNFVEFSIYTEKKKDVSRGLVLARIRSGTFFRFD